MLDMFSGWLRGRQGITANPIYRLAVGVATGKLAYPQALAQAQSYPIVSRLADGDFIALDRQAEFEAEINLQFGLLLARLNVAAVRTKGFEKIYVDLSIGLSDLLQQAGVADERDYYLDQARETAQRISYAAGYRRVLHRLARLAAETGDDATAERYLTEQLEIGREDTDTREDVDTALRLGSVALENGDEATAYDLYLRSARSGRRLNYVYGVVESLIRQAQIIERRGEPEAAIGMLSEADEMAARTMDAKLRGRVALTLARLKLETGQLASARDSFEAAYEQAKLDDDLEREAEALHGMADIEARLNQREDAVEHLTMLVSLDRRIGDQAQAGRALTQLAEVFMASNRFDDALRVLAEAREASHLAGDAQLNIRVHGLLGLVLMAQDNERGALEALETAVAESRSIGDTRTEARWLVAAGEALIRFRGPSNASIVVDRLRTLVRRHDDELLDIQVLELQGHIALVEERLEDAASYYEQAVNRSQRQGRMEAALHYLPVLSRISSQIGEDGQATAHLQRALTIAEQANDRQSLCSVHGQLARLHQQRGNDDEAIRHYLAALDCANELGNVRFASRALQGLATTYDTAGKPYEAMDYYRRTLEALSQIGDNRATARVHYNLGSLLIELGRDDEARSHLNRAMSIAEAQHDVVLADQAYLALQQLVPRTAGYSEADDLPLDEAPVRPRDWFNEPV
jgi:tetratricopeptide (TPR) repeat protein